MKMKLLATTAAAAILAFGGAAHAQQSSQSQTGGGGATESQARQGQTRQGQDGQSQRAQSGQQDRQGQAQEARAGQQQSQREGAKLHASGDVLMNVQKALNQKGFDVGEVSGELGEGTRSALRNFQEANDLPATGALTVETVNALGIDLGGGQRQGQGRQASAGKPAEIMVGPSIVMQVQRKLNEAGYDVGKVNGRWSQETSKAAVNYQRANGMTASGNLNMALLGALGIDLGDAGRQQAGGQRQQRAGGGQQAGGQQGQDGGRGQQAEATPLYIAPDVVQQTKMALNKKGFDAGAANAEWSKEARSALGNYLQSQGMPKSEMLTVAALSSLGIDWRSGGQGGQGGQQAGGTSGEGGSAGQGGQRSGGGQDNVRVITE